MQNTAICILLYISYVGTMNKDLNVPSSFGAYYMRASSKNQLLEAKQNSCYRDNNGENHVNQKLPDCKAGEFFILITFITITLRWAA